MKISFEISKTKPAEIVQKAADIVRDSAVWRAIHNILGDDTFVFVDAQIKAYMEAYQNNPVVYSVINPVIKRASTIGLTTDSGKETELQKLLKAPNPMNSGTEFLQSVFINLAACGHAYIWKNKVGSSPVELWNIPVSDVQLKVNDRLGISEFEFSSLRKTVFADEVIMLRMPNPDNANAGQNLTGLSPLRSCIKIIAEIEEALTANAKTLKNRMPKAFATAKTNGMITETQMKDLEKMIRQAGNSDRMFATSAPLDIRALGLSPVDLAIHETLTRAKRDIAAVYGVPFEYFEPSKYDNKGQAKGDFINNAVLPLFNIFLEAINTDKDLSRLHSEPLIIDHQTIPETRKDLVSLATALNQMWWLTGDEKREACDYEPTGEDMMKTFILPAGSVPLDQVDMLNNIAGG